MKNNLFSFQRTSVRSNISTSESTNTKLKALLDKWDTLESQDYHQTSKRRTYIEEILIDFHEKSEKSAEDEEKALKTLEDQLISLTEQFLQEKRGFSLNDDKHKGILNGLEENIKDSIQNDKEVYISRIEGYIVGLEEKIDELIKRKEEINQEKQGVLAKDIGNIEVMFDKIENRLKEGRKSREEGENRLNRELGDNVEKVYMGLEIERKAREETEGKLKKMIVEVGDGFFKEIEREREIRKENTELMIRLLEESCNKIDRNLI